VVAALRLATGTVVTMDDTASELGICARARRLGLPLLAAGTTDLDFFEDASGRLHPAIGGLLCGAVSVATVTARYAEAEARLCETCWTASINPTQRGAGQTSVPYAQILPWLSVTNDLADLASVVNLSLLIDAAGNDQLAGVLDEVNWLALGGRLLQELARSQDDYFPVELRTSERVANLHQAAHGALETWRTTRPGNEATTLAILEEVDLPSETALTAGVIARRLPLPLGDLSTVVLAVSENERQILETGIGTRVTGQWLETEAHVEARPVTTVDGVDIDRATLLGDLHRAGVGGGDPATLRRILEALDT
jgi:hypothetical protein